MLHYLLLENRVGLSSARIRSPRLLVVGGFIWFVQGLYVKRQTSLLMIDENRNLPKVAILTSGKARTCHK